jgi:hypothetical protein
MGPNPTGVLFERGNLDIEINTPEERGSHEDGGLDTTCNIYKSGNTLTCHQTNSR